MRRNHVPNLSDSFGRSGLVAWTDIWAASFERGALAIIMWIWTGDLRCIFSLASTARNPFWRAALWCMDCGRTNDPERRIIVPDWTYSFPEVVYFNCRCSYHLHQNLMLQVPDHLQRFDAEAVARTCFWALHQRGCICDVRRSGVLRARVFR